MNFLIPLLQIIWIDIVLSDDNALVIAMAFRSLPKNRREWAIALAAALAALLRIIFTLLCLPILAVPFVKLAGGLILLWIAIRLGGEEERFKKAVAPASIWASIRIVVLADAIMSVDNVIAVAAAAKGSWTLIIFGLALSIPLVIIGASIVAPLLRRVPALVWAGAGILGWIAGDLIGSDPAVLSFLRMHALLIETRHVAAAGSALVLLGCWLRVGRKSQRAA